MPDKPDLHTTRVLVVDDDVDALNAVSDALEEFGYEVARAASGERALEMAREIAFDVALCDLYMSGLTGMQLVRALSRIHPQMPIVLVTGSGDVEQSRQALEAGAVDFISRPVEPSTLPFVLENNLQRKRLEAKRLSETRADVLFKAIKALAAAIDAKSHFAGSHSARMADLCLEIGKEMDLPEDRLNVLELAAHIHDVGKISTPDYVLSKPGKLSDDEWVDILKHPSMGADFLAGIDELAEVASVVRHHHEHVDGSGYPDGLKGDAIPLLARILAVADAYEAMTSDRPYRRALPPENAVGELVANAGTQFDPAVVEAAQRVLLGPGLRAVRKKAA